jgi:hypothetical protein
MTPWRANDQGLRHLQEPSWHLVQCTEALGGSNLHYETDVSFAVESFVYKSTYTIINRPESVASLSSGGSGVLLAVTIAQAVSGQPHTMHEFPYLDRFHDVHQFHQTAPS